RIISNAEQLREQVDKILSITSLRAGKELLTFEKVSVKKLINKVLKDYSQKIKNKGLKLEKDFKTNPRIKADPEKLKELLDNLLDNAVRHTDSGSIKLTLGKSDNHVIISIKDTGSGIPDEQLKSLDVHKFDEESYNEVYEGVGLGLAISKLIAEGHKGSLEIKSKEGEGTTVIVKLPVK
ncbi:GHKL domain-containing protein, partial [archaeon]|nr:GHKL domain-containing protein [archaeon]